MLPDVLGGGTVVANAPATACQLPLYLGVAACRFQEGVRNDIKLLHIPASLILVQCPRPPPHYHVPTKFFSSALRVYIHERVLRTWLTSFCEALFLTRKVHDGLCLRLSDFIPSPLAA